MMNEIIKDAKLYFDKLNFNIYESKNIQVQIDAIDFFWNLSKDDAVGLFKFIYKNKDYEFSQRLLICAIFMNYKEVSKECDIPKISEQILKEGVLRYMQYDGEIFLNKLYQYQVGERVGCFR